MSSSVLYVCVLSEHNVAELQAVQYLRPTHVLAIVSDFLRKNGESPAFTRFVDAVRELSPDTTVEDLGRGLDGSTLSKCRDWVSGTLCTHLQNNRFADYTVIVNFTGGTKALTWALFGGLGGIVAKWQYIAFEKGETLLQTVDAEGNAIETHPIAPLPILSQARLYSDQIRVGKQISAEVDRQLLDYLYLLVSDPMSQYWRMSEVLLKLWDGDKADKYAEKLPEVPGIRVETHRVWVPFVAESPWELEWFRPFAQLSLEGAPTVDGNGIWIPRKRKKKEFPFVRWFKGDWYEQLVRLWLFELGLKDEDVITNVMVQRQATSAADGNDPGNEVDILFRYKGRLRLLEVKAGPQTDFQTTHAANKLYSAAGALGKVDAAYIFTPEYGAENAGFRAFHQRAIALGIEWLKGREDLENWLVPVDKRRQELVAVPR